MPDRSDVPRAIDPVEITRQRELGWPDFHPETYCHRCGGVNVPSWHVDPDLFAMAFPDTAHLIVCPGCFVVAHQQATGLMSSWKLVPDTPFERGASCGRQQR